MNQKKKNKITRQSIKAITSSFKRKSTSWLLFILQFHVSIILKKSFIKTGKLPKSYKAYI